MAALVPEHQPGGTCQVAALVVPAVLVQRVPVAEDDRDRCVVEAVDLDVQRHAVRREHDALPPAQGAQRLAGHRVRVQPEPVRREPLGRYHRPEPGRRGARGDPGDPGDPPPPGHVSSSLRPVRSRATYVTQQ